jgi:lysophospholipase L1-like esterase
MIDCLIIGDSIAVGTKMFRPECVSYSQGGITSHGWNKKFGNNDLTAKSVIISLGTNDWEKADTYGMLMNIRTKIKGDAKVFWILPNTESKPLIAHQVREVATQFGDTVLPTTRWQKDKIHPSWAGYKSIAERTK